MNIGDNVKIVKENNKDSVRYVGKIGKIIEITKANLFIVELDGKSETGTCLAKEVELINER